MRHLTIFKSIILPSTFLSLIAHDIIVGFPLLHLPAQVIERFPKTQKWLEFVKLYSTPYSTQLLQQLENLPKKESKKPNNKKEKAKVEEKKRKLKVLCIHGYRQSGKSAREKLGSFRYFQISSVLKAYDKPNVQKTSG